MWLKKFFGCGIYHNGKEALEKEMKKFGGKRNEKNNKK
jgi:hypothetical protein